MDQAIIGNGIDIDRAPHGDDISIARRDLEADARASIAVLVNIVQRSMNSLPGVRAHPAVVADNGVIPQFELGEVGGVKNALSREGRG